MKKAICYLCTKKVMTSSLNNFSRKVSRFRDFSKKKGFENLLVSSRFQIKILLLRLHYE